MQNKLYECSDVFLSYMLEDNNASLLRLEFFMYIYTGYASIKDNLEYNTNFYELDNFPVSLQIENRYKELLPVYQNNTLKHNTLKDISDIYNSFKDLTNSEIYAIMMDNHYNNHNKIFNEKNNKPIKYEYIKKWVYNSFIKLNGNRIFIDETKIKEKTKLSLDYYKYEKIEVNYNPKKPNDEYNSIITYTKEMLGHFIKNGEKINLVKLNYLMYLSEAYYMAYEDTDHLFKQDFEVTKFGPSNPTINGLYDYIKDQISTDYDSKYIERSTFVFDYEEHFPISYIKKVYEKYGKLTTTELENILYQTNSPYTILKRYGDDNHYKIPKLMTKKWLLDNKDEIDDKKLTPKKENIFNSITKLFSKKNNISLGNYQFYEYSYQKYCENKEVKKLISSDDVMLNSCKKIINKFNKDLKKITLNHLNLLMYLIDGFYSNDKSLFKYNFKITEGIPTNDIIKCFAIDYLDDEENISLNNELNYNLDKNINEYLDYMYNVFNDIPYTKLKKLCLMENSPFDITKKYTSDDIISKEMTRGWLKNEFLHSYDKDIEYDILKKKIKDIK